MNEVVVLSGIRHLLLDAVGVLFHPQPESELVLQEVLSRFGIDTSLRAIKRGVTIAEALFSPLGEMSEETWLAFNSVVLRSIMEPDPDTEQELSKAMSSEMESRLSFEVFPDVRESLDSLRVTIEGLGVLSNWELQKLPLNAVLRDLGLSDYFDVVVASNEVNVRKPDKAIFELTLDRLGANPKDTAFVGDRFDVDIKGAREAGVKPILLWRAREQPSPPLQDPDLLSIHSLLDLVPMFRGRDAARSDSE